MKSFKVSYNDFLFYRKNSTILHGRKSRVQFNADVCFGTEDEINFLEHVEVVSTIEYSVRGALEMSLTAPSGKLHCIT